MFVPNRNLHNARDSSVQSPGLFLLCRFVDGYAELPTTLMENPTDARLRLLMP